MPSPHLSTSRRTVAKAAAWSVPVVALGAAAPALAASSPSITVTGVRNPVVVGEQSVEFTFTLSRAVQPGETVTITVTSVNGNTGGEPWNPLPSTVTVPAGSRFGLPADVSFIGGAFAEATLIRLAYGFEQATRARLTPAFAPPGIAPPGD